MSTPLIVEKDPIDPPRALGEFLRAARERQQPENFGLPPGQRRRARGLRREEVAALCDISPTWYTWLEQGRTTAVSVTTLSDLAKGLRLSLAERAYLFQLAGRADPEIPDNQNPDIARHEELIDTIRSPAYILDRHWNALVWKPPAEKLFHDWLGNPSSDSDNPDRNLLRYVFLHQHAQIFIM